MFFHTSDEHFKNFISCSAWGMDTQFDSNENYFYVNVLFLFFFNFCVLKIHLYLFF